MFLKHNRVITIEGQPTDVFAVTGLSDVGLAEVLKFPASASSPTGQVSGFAALLPVVNAWLKAYDSDPELKGITDAGQREKILALLQGSEGVPGIIEAVATLATEGARVHLAKLVGNDVPLTAAQRVTLFEPLTALHVATNPNDEAAIEAILQLEEALKIQVDATKIVAPDVTDVAQALEQAQNPETPTDAPDAPADAPDAPADPATSADPAESPASTTASSAPALPDAPSNLPVGNSATITIVDAAAFFRKMMQIDQDLADGVAAVMQGVTSVSAGLVEATTGMQRVMTAIGQKNNIVANAFGVALVDTPALAEKTQVEQ